MLIPSGLPYSFVLLLISLSIGGCAYRFGLSDRGLPGGYSQVAIPVFKNRTPEVGIEPIFTNALVRRFARSQVAKITDKEDSPLVLEGTIIKVDTVLGAIADKKQIAALPGFAVLVTQYRLTVNATITLKRKSDEKIIWQGSFSNERVYEPPRIGTPIVNSANATYNQSARIYQIGLLAEEMMSEAHDRITENF